MLGFENFDVRAWVSKGVTMHCLKKASANKPKRKVAPVAKALVFAVAAAASSQFALASNQNLESAKTGITKTGVTFPSLAKVILPTSDLSASTLLGCNNSIISDDWKVSAFVSQGNESLALLESHLSAAVNEAKAQEAPSASAKLLGLAELVSKIDFSQGDIKTWADRLSLASANAND